MTDLTAATAAPDAPIAPATLDLGELPPVPADWAGEAPVPLRADLVFNGYVAAQVAYALDRLGLFDRLAGGAPCLLADCVPGPGTDRALLRQLLGSAAAFGWVLLAGDTVALTGAGAELARMRGYFNWAVGGYQTVFGEAAGLVTGQRRFGRDVRRDEAMVALGAGQNAAALMAGTFADVVSDVDFDTIADLGSGNCGRLADLVRSRPGSNGIGFDISADATELARHDLSTTGMADRVAAVRADVLDLLAGEPAAAGRWRSVDAVMSFFLLHDLLADPARRADVLPRLREAFPNCRRLLIADTVLRPADAPADRLPMFAAGFELAHALMGVPLHSRETYEALFAAAGLRIRRRVPFGTPHSWLYLLDAD